MQKTIKFAGKKVLENNLEGEMYIYINKRREEYIYKQEDRKREIYIYVTISNNVT